MDEKKEESVSLDDYQEQINVWYKANNIIRERSELYYDFILSLLHLIDDTYLGSDILRADIDIFNHFTWCFNRVIENFEKERIFFVSKSSHYEYLWRFFYKAFYKNDKDDRIQSLLEYFKILFNFSRVKTSAELESYSDFYKILDQNLKKTN